MAGCCSPDTQPPWGRTGPRRVPQEKLAEVLCGVVARLMVESQHLVAHLVAVARYLAAHLVVVVRHLAAHLVVASGLEPGRMPSSVVRENGGESHTVLTVDN